MSKLGALYLTKPTGAKHTATVIFFHGSGSNGEDMKEWVRLMVKNFSYPHIKVMYPTAPLQPYSLLGGGMSNVWFDRSDINIEAKEQKESILNIQKEVNNLIKQENLAGIPTNRIITGGFSMGGALSMYTGYSFERNLAGVFAFSSFLNENSFVYDNLKTDTVANTPPLLQIHGDSDELVSLEWGKSTFDNLTSIGVKGQFHVMESLGHSINKRGMRIIKDWVEKLLPED